MRKMFATLLLVGTFAGVGQANQVVPFEWQEIVGHCPANVTPQCPNASWYEQRTVCEQRCGRRCSRWRIGFKITWRCRNECWQECRLADVNVQEQTFFDEQTGICRGPYLSLDRANRSNCTACVKQMNSGGQISCMCVINPVCPAGLRYNPSTKCCEG